MAMMIFLSPFPKTNLTSNARNNLFPKIKPPPNTNLNFSLFSNIPNNPLISINIKPPALFQHHRITDSAVAVSGVETRAGSEEDAADLLDRVQVFDLNGNPILISDLWKHRKAVVAFARHFGCVLCRKRADYLAAKKHRMDASGVALVLIGPGSVDQAKVFQEQRKFKGEVYADPNYSSYEALRFVYGVSTTFTPGAGLKIIQAYMEGYRQDWELSFEKDTRTRGGWQQGGIIVAGPGKNNISYIHRDKEAGDDPNIEEIMKACCT